MGYIKIYLTTKAPWFSGKITRTKRIRRMTKSQKERRDEYLKYRDSAYQIAKDRLGHFNTSYHLEWNRISIKNQKTRWGSCSKKKNLNFNYRIALLPQRAVDYIIVHELCHLKEMNHSENFWREVAKTIPDYREQRNNLKKEGLKLS